MTSPLHFAVELLSDAAFRSRSGAGRAVDFVPGYTLLGRIAQDYAEAAKQGLAWELFHSGETRFGNARLLNESGVPARPVPLSFRFPKGKSGALAARKPIDGALGQSDPSTPREDKPDLQAWPDGAVAKVQSRYDLKTAVNYETQRAEEGQLFRLRTLVRGQRFGGAIHFNGPKAAAARAFVAQRLEGEARLGWSRRAEYGRVRLRVVDAPPTWAETETNPLRILLLSETCMLDEGGQPTVEPTAAHFGLAVGTFDRDRSFIRTCRYTPFNTHRERPDMERVALAAGSLLTFKGVSAPTADIEKLGVGMHRAEGCGAVWINPPTAADWKSGAGASIPQTPDAQAGSPPTDELWQWLQSARAERRVRATAEQERTRLVKQLGPNTRPSPSQWRRVAAVARAAESSAALENALFSAPKALCTHGVAQHQWRGLIARFRPLVSDTSPLGVALAAEELARTQEASRD